MALYKFTYFKLLTYLLTYYVGVADQLQTNYATDLRHMLKSVFDSYTADTAARTDDADDDTLAEPVDEQVTPTDGFRPPHLTNRSITSDGTSSPNHNHHYSASSLIGILICTSYFYLFCFSLST